MHLKEASDEPQSISISTQQLSCQAEDGGVTMQASLSFIGSRMMQFVKVGDEIK